MSGFMKGVSFERALSLLKSGVRVRRAGWNGKGMWLRLDEPEALGLPPDWLPWISMKTADDRMVPWLASQTDILAEDWEEVCP